MIICKISKNKLSVLKKMTKNLFMAKIWPYERTDGRTDGAGYIGPAARQCGSKKWTLKSPFLIKMVYSSVLKCCTKDLLVVVSFMYITMNLFITWLLSNVNWYELRITNNETSDPNSLQTIRIQNSWPESTEIKGGGQGPRAGGRGSVTPHHLPVFPCYTAKTCEKEPVFGRWIL